MGYLGYPDSIGLVTVIALLPSTLGRGQAAPVPFAGRVGSGQKQRSLSEPNVLCGIQAGEFS